MTQNQEPPRFDHEKRDVYRVALSFSGWSFELSADLAGPLRHARDQLLRASQSVPLNIAEGNGKRSAADRRRSFEIARGSALECAAILDVLVASKSLSVGEIEVGKGLLVRVVAMLTRMIDNLSTVREDNHQYGDGKDVE